MSRVNARHRRRTFTADEDAVIFAWCKGEIGLFAACKQINSSVPTIKARASELCGEHLNIDVPYHKPNKNYSYHGKNDEPLDLSNYTCTVGSDKLLRRLREGYR